MTISLNTLGFLFIVFAALAATVGINAWSERSARKKLAPPASKPTSRRGRKPTPKLKKLWRFAYDLFFEDEKPQRSRKPRAAKPVPPAR